MSNLLYGRAFQSRCKLEEFSCRLIVAILTIFRVEQNHLTSVCIMLIEIEHIKLFFNLSTFP